MPRKHPLAKSGKSRPHRADSRLVLAVIARLNEIPPMLHQNLDLIKRLDALQVKKQKPCTPLPRDVALLVAETKVDLAMQTYELLDQHAKALDRYLVMRSGNPKTQPLSPQALNMEVDPNEPTYCVCGQVAFGEMISCDNPDCEQEWFHVQCVGGQVGRMDQEAWFCPTCAKAKQQPPPAPT